MLVLNDNHTIVSARMLIGNKLITLAEKPQGDSGKIRCHFYEQQFGKYKIVLRLDWEDRDENGNPTLDSDIYTDGKKFNVGKKQWHHTRKSLESGQWVYKWKPEVHKFRNLSIEITFKLQTTNQLSISGRSRIIPAENNVKISKEDMERQRKILEELKK
jgi:hypothetical protein